MAAFLAGAVCGVLSAFGLGGGTLLLIYMTTWAGIPQALAQGINLLYFLPAAGVAIPAHLRNGYIKTAVLLPAILAGLATATLTAWVASGMETELLHRCFGFFLIVVGLSELFRQDAVSPEDGSGDRSDSPPG